MARQTATELQQRRRSERSAARLTQHSAPSTQHFAKHRLFVGPDQVQGDRVQFDEGQSHRLRRVLRLAPGDLVYVLDGQARRATAIVERLDRTGGEARVEAWEDWNTEPRCAITLYQALLKQDRFEWVLQKGTEVGIAAFVPVVTERCVARPSGVTGRLDRWRAIVREAAEQSGRGRLPEVQSPRDLDDVLGSLVQPTIVCWEAAGDRRLRDVLTELPPDTDRIGLVIGPEGGLTSGEVDRLAAAGARIAGLGRRILRAETAGPIAAALTLYVQGDLG